MSTAIAQPTPDKIQVLAHEQYESPESLTPASVAPDPLAQFRAWFKAVSEGGAVRGQTFTGETVQRAGASQPESGPQIVTDSEGQEEDVSGSEKQALVSHRLL